MDDVTSGFNIGSNMSLDASFNEMMGFTGEEVSDLLGYYHSAGVFTLDKGESLASMQEWYNNYRFSRTAVARLYHPEMALYFLGKVVDQRAWPDQLIDPNIRIDYGKLRHLMLVDRRLNGNFSLLQSLIQNGEIAGNVALSFPLERILQPENFISLLLYFGLLTFSGEQAGRPLLRIPNLAIRELLYGFIRDGFQEVSIFRVDPWRLTSLLSDMAYRGEWRPFFALLASEIEQQTSIRDYLNGEKVIQGFLLAYLNVSNFFLT